ncbi:MAG: response regulator transcription factor [Actinomycetota bacterium]
MSDHHVQDDDDDHDLDSVEAGSVTHRVLLVDDQPLVRVGLGRILGSEVGIEVVAEASDGREAIAQLATNDVDVVVMDIRMRGMDGIEATTRIRAADGPPVLVLTTFDDDEILWGAIDAGAAGFILKEATAEDLIRATVTVAEGGAWLDPVVTPRVLARRRAHGGPGVAGATAMSEVRSAGTDDRLTDREHDVLVLMAAGKTNPEIAEELIVGQATVKSHISSIFTKLAVRDRAGAIVHAYQNGLVEF